MKAKEKQSATQKKKAFGTPPSEELLNLIEDSNLVPEGLETISTLVDTARIWRVEMPRHPWSTLSFDDHIDELIFEQINKMGARLKEESVLNKIPPADIHERMRPLWWSTRGRLPMRKRYSDLVDGKAILGSLLNNDRDWHGPVATSCWIKINPDTQAYELHTESILQLFVGVEVGRIRRCEICSKIFWASHGNKQSCSDACGNIRRLRRHRDKMKEIGKSGISESSTEEE
jgi:hypothetical protein